MGKFLKSEKLEQSRFKQTSPTISTEARADGLYRGKLYDFCLPRDCALENLAPEIRTLAPAVFTDQQIKWHDGQNGRPSNHLCDSMVCCVNFMMPFAHRPDALAAVLRPYYPLKRMLPLEDGRFVTFEWIGAQNYLGEKVRGNGVRTRGANCTSADAAVMFERLDGSKQMVLIEWKYTESYSPTPFKVSKSGTDRTLIYRHLWERDDCPIDRRMVPDFEALFYEPFYQLMRQQFLAAEMEKAHEMGAYRVSLLHIAPAHNTDFRRVTSPALRGLGESATGVWQKLVRDQSRFLSLSSEKLFGGLTEADLPDMGEWLTYIKARYRWLVDA